MALIDNYFHTDDKILYISENIPTPDTEEIFSEHITFACECTNICEGPNCECLKNSGAVYENQTICEKNPQKPFYECNSYCKCHGSNCGNRLVQFGPNRHLKVINCGWKKGLGLSTTERISRGNFVCEYAGEVLSEIEANNRFKENVRLKRMNYIFCLKEHYGKRVVKTFVDPSKFGNISRYINHSCRPNCRLIPIRVDTVVPKLCIFAIDEIMPHTELTFDYGDGSLGFQQSTDDVERIECLCFCGDGICRKYLPYCQDL